MPPYDIAWDMGAYDRHMPVYDVICHVIRIPDERSRVGATLLAVGWRSYSRFLPCWALVTVAGGPGFIGLGTEPPDRASTPGLAGPWPLFPGSLLPAYQL
jgi:hypothetical protein